MNNDTESKTSKPSSVDAARPPYVGALGVFIVVLAGYVWTLAPTVTFWDAGEFIATAHILGIPHPPGTPLFTLIANVWARLVPIGEYAFRTNLMTAVFSAAGAAFLFLLVAQALRGWVPANPTNRPAGGVSAALESDLVFVIGGAAAAAILSAFVFTVWQNSNETEVYMVATFSIAVTAWLAWVWRKSRGRPRAPHILLFIVYLAAVSIGNHLLALLAGPAIITFMAHVHLTEPLPRAEDQNVEKAQIAVVLGTWALLIGTGLGNTTLLALGGIVFMGAAAYATLFGGTRFAVAALAIALVGVSTYLFLYLRANVGPFINEADPSTWGRLWEVIQRKQYPPRSPLDNPIYPSGPDNPGRSLTLILLQIQNYVQYFDWQWSNGLAPNDPVFARIRLPFTLAFTSLGIYGWSVLRERDRSVFWLLLALFLTTGPGLMGYMNFKPGFSLAFDKFPDFQMHEVRERDYFFTVSFQVWGAVAAIGLAGLYRQLRERVRAGASRAPVWAGAMVLVVAFLPFALNFEAATRRQQPQARLAKDFAYDLLQSAEPYGIVFTNGDNDTFPLWYAQEVEGVRQDVWVVNLSLGNTDWYLRQLRDNPVRPFDPEQAPWFADLAPAEPPPALHTMKDAEIAALFPQALANPLAFRVGRINKTFPARTPLYVKDILMLRLIVENWQRRPIYYSMTVGGGNWLGLNNYLTQEGLVLRLNVAHVPDSSALAPGILGLPVNVPRTDSLVTDVYRYADLFKADTLDLDPTNRNIAINLSYAFYSLGQAYTIRGDRERGLEYLRRGFHLAPIPELASGMTSLTQPPAAAGDSSGAR